MTIEILKGLFENLKKYPLSCLLGCSIGCLTSFWLMYMPSSPILEDVNNLLDVAFATAVTLVTISLVTLWLYFIVIGVKLLEYFCSCIRSLLEKYKIQKNLQAEKIVEHCKSIEKEINQITHFESLYKYLSYKEKTIMFSMVEEDVRLGNDDIHIVKTLCDNQCLELIHDLKNDGKVITLKPILKKKALELLDQELSSVVENFIKKDYALDVLSLFTASKKLEFLRYSLLSTSFGFVETGSTGYRIRKTDSYYVRSALHRSPMPLSDKIGTYSIIGEENVFKLTERLIPYLEKAYDIRLENKICYLSKDEIRKLPN